MKNENTVKVDITTFTDEQLKRLASHRLLGLERSGELDSFLDCGVQAYMSCRGDPGLLKVIDLTWQLSGETAREVEKIAFSSEAPIDPFFYR